jgi:hypothetical protein
MRWWSCGDDLLTVAYWRIEIEPCRDKESGASKPDLKSPKAKRDIISPQLRRTDHPSRTVKSEKWCSLLRCSRTEGTNEHRIGQRSVRKYRTASPAVHRAIRDLHPRTTRQTSPSGH